METGQQAGVELVSLVLEQSPIIVFLIVQHAVILRLGLAAMKIIERWIVRRTSVEGALLKVLLKQLEQNDRTDND